MTRSRQKALDFQVARIGDYHKTGMCLREVRTAYDIPAKFQDGYDHDGINEAMDAWVGASRKHPGDRRPPLGVPVFFSGGSAGHVAIATGFGTEVVSTDWPQSRFGVATIEQIERQWGRTYVGWTEDLNGVLIPSDAPPPPAPPQEEEEIEMIILYVRGDANPPYYLAGGSAAPAWIADPKDLDALRAAGIKTAGVSARLLIGMGIDERTLKN